MILNCWCIRLVYRNISDSKIRLGPRLMLRLPENHTKTCFSNAFSRNFLIQNCKSIISRYSLWRSGQAPPTSTPRNRVNAGIGTVCVSTRIDVIDKSSPLPITLIFTHPSATIITVNLFSRVL